MHALRNDPRILADHFPALAEVVKQAEPRNLSRELKGTPDEMRECVVVYGFGQPMSAVVAVSLSNGDATADCDTITRIYGIKPLLFGIQLT
jgi:hypothetical protein